jgi:hypothetical protein
MQRSKALMIAITCVTLGTACVSLAPGADKVRMTKTQADVAACKPVGNVRVPVNPQSGTVDIGNAQTQFRNQVVGLGGNTGLVTYGLLEVPSEGLAYQCP